MADLSLQDMRYQWLEENIRYLLAMQIKATREARGWSKAELGDKTGMTEVEITHLEDPKGRGITMEKLKLLAQAFDVGLLVRFVPFAERSSTLAPAGYDEESKRNKVK